MEYVETVGKYIADNTDLTLGQDIFLNSIEDDKEGIIVKYVRTISDFGSITVANYNFYSVWKKWSTNKNYLKEIRDLLEARRGKTDALWAVSGELRVEGHGVDTFDRNIGVISVNINY